MMDNCSAAVSGKMVQKRLWKLLGFCDRKVLTKDESGGSICKLSGNGPRNKAETKENL